jgi:hypothetical protein
MPVSPRPDPLAANPTPSSRTRNPQTARIRGELDLDPVGLGVLHHVGQRLADEEVARAFDVGAESCAGKTGCGVHVDGDRQSVRPGLDSGQQSPVTQQWGMDAVGELT